MAGGGLLLNHCGILLRALIHGVHGRVDFLQTSRLFAGSDDDGADMGVDLLDFCHDEFERLASLVDEVDAVFHLLAGSADQRLDFLCGIGGTLGEFTHFLRDDGKALARITRTGGFDACVQRKQVGLESDIVDDADDIADFA